MSSSNKAGIGIGEVSSASVILHRGAGVQQHEGNQQYIKLVEDNLQEYIGTKSVSTKDNVRKKIFDDITSRGADAVASGASLTSSTKIVIEKKEHPDGWDWELKSVTYQKEHYNDTQNIKTFLLVATIFKEIASLPGDILKLHFLQFNLSVPYIKTRLLRAENIRHHCPTLAMVINALDTRDIDCYFQFYTGKWTEKLYLTSIHQDGGDAHSRLWRILFRVFGATTFFTSERRQDAFYRATCDMPRATVATKKAFCGVLEDMSKNRSSSRG
ncbi:expressed unknown protein [Seminavis robusta]|uniref:DUF6824 domain-containing protein n=1 Tax=Seminavis robusta TaxID=568900 RepID=A0A9N8ELX5_9STRA|nr:expressed unknown protein [Seminavis robusta]|eukprot:Sro1223_g253900.1 n/a (271) ;mRNA; r:12687-13606